MKDKFEKVSYITEPGIFIIVRKINNMYEIHPTITSWSYPQEKNKIVPGFYLEKI
jgi:hypothetical protein